MFTGAFAAGRKARGIADEALDNPFFGRQLELKVMEFAF